MALSNVERSTRVLVISDDWPLSEALVNFAKTKGGSAEIAASAEVAIEDLSRDCYNVVMIDVNTVSSHGLRIFHKAKAGGDRTAIIFIVSPFNVLGVVHAIGDGAFGFINRPVNMAEAGPIIERALNYAVMEKKFYAGRLNIC